MSNNKQQTAVQEQIKKHLELPHRETIISTNTLQTKPFDNQKTENMSNNKQQTAVEWLISQMPEDYMRSIPFELVEQAKEMEKEQIEETARTYFHECSSLTPKQYYELTYGGNK